MQLSEFRDFAHYLMGARQSHAIYPPEHPRVSHAVRELYLRTREILHDHPEVRVAIADNEVIVGQSLVPAEGALLAGLAKLLQDRGVGKLRLTRGIRRWEIAAFVRALSVPDDELETAGGVLGILRTAGVDHVHAGVISSGEHGAATPLMGSLSEVWAVYTAGVSAVRRLRKLVREGEVDPVAFREATQVASGLVDLVEEQADSFILLQALHRHDEYSYTHSLNVALLSLAMAAQMEVPAEWLMSVALAALFHDIGKELVPDEVLNKPGQLSAEEWEVMQRHTADGARLLLLAPGADDLSLVVAYEHQLAYELDNPDHGKWPLHFVSEIVCIADVYDALRSRRPYRMALPPDESMRIMEQEADKKFDPDLFQGFRRMLGYYPPGTCLRLDDGSVAVSLCANPEDVARPVVMRVRDARGADLDPTETIDLAVAGSPEVAEIVDGDAHDLDPLDYL